MKARAVSETCKTYYQIKLVKKTFKPKVNIMHNRVQYVHRHLKATSQLNQVTRASTVTTSVQKDPL